MASAHFSVVGEKLFLSRAFLTLYGHRALLWAERNRISDSTGHRPGGVAASPRVLAYGSRGYLRHQLAHMPQEPRQTVLSLGRSAEKASVESINASRSASAPRTGTSPSVKRSVIRVQYPFFDDWEDVASRSLIRWRLPSPRLRRPVAGNARPGPQHPRRDLRVVAEFRPRCPRRRHWASVGSTARRRAGSRPVVSRLAPLNSLQIAQNCLAQGGA
jgi:hypothetical protein